MKTRNIEVLRRAPPCDQKHKADGCRRIQSARYFHRSPKDLKAECSKMVCSMIDKIIIYNRRKNM